jgi:hypothetical protein
VNLKNSSHSDISIRTAALIVGLTIFLPVAPYAEYFVYQKLVIPGNTAATVQNIIENRMLFLSGILGYVIMFILDILIAWAMYIFFTPVNKALSLLNAWFRLIYAAIAIVSLFNLVNVLQLVTSTDYSTVFEPQQLHAQVKLSLNAFGNGITVGFVFFSINLMLGGYLAFRSGFIPKTFGILLIIAGIGYLTTSLKPFLFPNYSLDFIMITYLGELIFAFWLLIKGSRIQIEDVKG